MGRAPCCDKANVKKGPWSPEEDAKLKDYIHKFGTGGNWIALPLKAGLKRCGKSCRLRWLNYLRPNIKHGEFSDEEDRIICSLYASIGSRWSIIAAQLPGRTDNDIKNYWNTKLKKKLQATSTPPNLTLNHIVNHKKTHLNQNHLLHNNNNDYLSSLISSPSSLLSCVLSASSSSPYPQCTSTYYNNSPASSLSSMTMSFTHGCYNNDNNHTTPSNNNNNNNNDTLILMQNYQQVKDNSTLLVFGGADQPQQPQHQPSSCSSDGSITQITTQVKCEAQNFGTTNFQNNGLLNHHHHQVVNHHHHQEEEDQRKRSSDNDQNDMLMDDRNPSCTVVNGSSLWGQSSQSNSLLDYGLEEIKQLISTNNSNVGNMNSFNYFDLETKAESHEESNNKVMYYYDSSL